MDTENKDLPILTDAISQNLPAIALQDSASSLKTDKKALPPSRKRKQSSKTSNGEEHTAAEDVEKTDSRSAQEEKSSSPKMAILKNRKKSSGQNKRQKSKSVPAETRENSAQVYIHKVPIIFSGAIPNYYIDENQNLTALYKSPVEAVASHDKSVASVLLLRQKKNRKQINETKRKTPHVRGVKGKKSQAFVSELETSATPLTVAEMLTYLLRFPALPPSEKKMPLKHEDKKKAKTTELVPVQQLSRRMYISVIPGEQVEVALSQQDTLLEYYLDMLHQQKLKGNIYKGVIHNIDPNLQAAFVNYGVGKNGFLQIDEVHPEYWQAPQEPGSEKKFPPIQKVLKVGQELLVQVVKEPSGNKGAFLTTWLSLAGRFLVLTPGQEQIGVSRKVTDPEERIRLRELMNGIDPGSGLGVIVRTVGEGATKTTLKTDLQYLKRLWRDIRKKATEVSSPALIHQEPGLSERAVRDYLTEDVNEIWVDNEEEAANVRAMVGLLFPRKKDLVRLHTDIHQTLWDKFNLASQIEQIYEREVPLPSGGRLVFDQTEALMAIDINSGKISGKGNFEAMAYKTNMEATLAIAKQLRLRDIGGQVVIDFIEMREKKHVLEVEKSLRQAMKNDRARHDVARMSSFGLLELVRQRMGSSALSICMETCPFCGGTGQRRNLEWQALRILRELKDKLNRISGTKYVFDANKELGMYLLNNKRDALAMLEKNTGKSIEIKIQI